MVQPTIDLTLSEEPSESNKNSIANMVTKSAASQKPQAKKPKPSAGDLKPKIHMKDQTSSQSTPTEEKDYTSFSSLLASPMVIFHLGPKKKAYHIHRDLICSTSPIFQSHFGALETKTPTTDMYLPDHDPKAFELFLSFLYRKQFPEIVPPPPPPPSPAAANDNTSTTTPQQDKDIHGANLSLLLTLHFMAHDWSLPLLQNLTLDHISRYLGKTSTLFRSRQIALIYSKLQDPKAPLKRFAVDHFVWCVMKKSVGAKARRTYLVNRAGVADMDFLWDVVEGVVGGRKYPVPVEPGEKGRCAYHVHDNGARCEE
ncbi:MAG: hypothetical protein LQ343_003084 [Gyalolechia ehrenbergii]|nr:MAG: hypothetical protein LQ343_003084 [Gyalolechia ehrenbergii]